MTPDNIDQTPLFRPPVGNLTDFVEGVDEQNPLDIEIAVKDDGKIIIFYNRVFRTPVSWFEFNLSTNKLDFIMEEGEIRDAGMPLFSKIAKHMQNAHQILTILMDEKTGQAKEGVYVPLIIHSS
ncbi:MAG: hypothetical protein ACT4OY_08945 [Alphaproteobacteria bacterium]